jgi:hypothetical protein
VTDNRARNGGCGGMVSILLIGIVLGAFAGGWYLFVA